MQIFVPKERRPGETRIPLLPAAAEKITALAGAELVVEAGIGAALGIPDSAYEKAKARISTDPAADLAGADMVLRLNKPSRDEIGRMKRGSLHASMTEPFEDLELTKAFAAAGVNAISLEMIPRTTIAQKMDVLSSQANLAGYVAVILAAGKLDKLLPMMNTPCGTITPSRVFIVGVGVAGLQAIATARRLGARVEAFDTRPVVEEQVQSLGAKFVKIDLGETGQTKDGYAKALTEEQIQKQREGMAKVCANADIVITTAQVFGRKAPVIITADMVARMKPGTVVVDCAIESGGNVEGARLGEEVKINGVTIIGQPNLPGRVPFHASQMFGSNLVNLLTHFWVKDSKAFVPNREDEIIQGCMITWDGEVVQPTIKKLIEGAKA